MLGSLTAKGGVDDSTLSKRQYPITEQQNFVVQAIHISPICSLDVAKQSDDQKAEEGYFFWALFAGRGEDMVIGLRAHHNQKHYYHYTNRNSRRIAGLQNDSKLLQLPHYSRLAIFLIVSSIRHSASKM